MSTLYGLEAEGLKGLGGFTGAARKITIWLMIPELRSGICKKKDKCNLMMYLKMNHYHRTSNAQC